jgi:hypothetical protein
MEHLMAIELPEPVAGYFAADQSTAKKSAVRYFTETAIVVDEGKTYVGHQAIQSWMEESSTKYSYVVDPFELTTLDRQIVVSAHLTGNFPGSPIDLRYRFEIFDGKIAKLEIGI